MENKTDKPYSLQDAKDDIAIERGYSSWKEFVFNEIHKHPITTFWDFIYTAAELYASKATEELRKENEELQTQFSMFQTDRSERIEEMKRLKESNKEMVEALDEHKKLLKSMGEPGGVSTVRLHARR